MKEGYVIWEFWKKAFWLKSSPVMLISWKVTQDKRVVTDFRHLNMRIAKNNLAYPLLKDMFMLLGGSKCKVLSVLNLKDAFHSLRLTESSKKYCRILPYFSSASYLYQRMPIGLNISPAVWQLYINDILSCLSSRKYCEAIMDDLLLFNTQQADTLWKNSWLIVSIVAKMSWKFLQRNASCLEQNCNIWVTPSSLRRKRVCVKPLRSRLETIQRLKPPTNQKGCRSFAGIVNFVSIFCPELQKLLKPIYEYNKER